MNEAKVTFLIGICAGALIIVSFFIFIDGTELGCYFGFHDPYAEVDLVIWNNTDAVANYWVRCRICGRFLTGINTMRVPIDDQ